MQESSKYKECKRCGISELAETLKNDICKVCSQVDYEKNLRQESDIKSKTIVVSNYDQWRQYYFKTLRRDKYVYTLSNILIPSVCFLPVFFIDNSFYFILSAAIIFIILEVCHDLLISKIYNSVLLCFSAFEKNAASDAEREDIKIFSRSLVGLSWALSLNPRNWTDNDIYDMTSAPIGLGKVIYKDRGRERLFYLRWWYNNNKDEKNYGELAVAVLRAANLHPSLFEIILTNRKLVGYAYKAIVFLFLIFLSLYDYSFFKL